MAACLYTVATNINNLKSRKQNPKLEIRWGWWFLIALITLWLLSMTLSALRPVRYFDHINLIPFSALSRAFGCLLDRSCPFQRRAFVFLLINVLGNIVVFIPLGVSLAGALHQHNCWQTIRRGTMGGFILSLVIELMQLAIPTRATDVDDLIFNTLGATLGVLFFLLLSRSVGNPTTDRKVW